MKPLLLKRTLLFIPLFSPLLASLSSPEHLALIAFSGRLVGERRHHEDRSARHSSPRRSPRMGGTVPRLFLVQFCSQRPLPPLHRYDPEEERAAQRPTHRMGNA